MTPEAQRIALVEVCKKIGWELIPEEPSLVLWDSEECTQETDPLIDLNAMHEAERVLQDKCKYWPDYIDELSKLFPCSIPNTRLTNYSQMVHATAAQRAEAFLKTVGKWDDTL